MLKQRKERTSDDAERRGGGKRTFYTNRQSPRKKDMKGAGESKIKQVVQRREGENRVGRPIV